MRWKSLELGWRRAWIRVVTRRLARRLPPAMPDWPSARVLFLRHDRIGDMILSTGLLRAIAGAHPGVSIDVLASAANAPVVERDPAVSATIVFRRGGILAYPRVVRTLRARRYDAVIDCMVTAPSLTTLLLMWASGARHRVGVGGRGNDAAYTLLVPPQPPGMHMAERLGALGAAFGIDVAGADFSPRIALGDEERTVAEAEWAGDGGGVHPGLRLLVNVSAGLAIRHWPDRRYVDAVTDAAAAAGLPRPRGERDTASVGGRGALNIRVIASPHEQDRAAFVAAALGGAAVTTPSIRAAFALVATADAVLTPDTSIAHAASAFRRPCVALYVHGTSAEWGLYGTRGASIESPERNLAALPVAPVASALAPLLRETAESPARDL